MNPTSVGDVTTLLNAVREGSAGAADRLMSLVYDELKRIARNRVGDAEPRLLEPTALVHEAYLRLFNRDSLDWQNRHHFFWAAARAMRDILVERARHAHAERRGAGKRPLTLHDQLPAAGQAGDLLAINDAIRRLEIAHPDCARIVMLRYFAGLTREQVADVTGLSESAVWREWSFAKAWLLAELEGEHSPKAGVNITDSS